jgi:N-acetylglucosamine kinase
MSKGSLVFLGLDGGGTKTRAVLIDLENREIARAEGGPSNYHSVGWAGTRGSLSKAIHTVLGSAAASWDQVAAVGLGMAGIARPRDRQAMRELLVPIVGGAPLAITHDAEAALLGGIGRRHGVVLIAGTGTIAYGVNARGQAQRADGWGHLLGDDGSAYWIGRAALRALARACDGRGPPTLLTDILFPDLRIHDCDKLVERVYVAGLDVPRIAALAPLVELAALEGDEIARELLGEAGSRLGHTLCVLIDKLQVSESAFETLLLGGVLRGKGVAWEAVVAALDKKAPLACVIEPRHDAAFGAALLAHHEWATSTGRLREEKAP